MSEVNTVSSANQQNQIDPGSIDREGLKNSLAEVINSLTGKKKEGNKLANERVSEDLLYAALVSQQLKKSNPALSDELLRALKKNYKKDTKQGVNQPIYQITQEILKKASKRGTLSSAQQKAIDSYAFGKSQLDKNSSHLKRRVIQVAVGSNGSNNIEATLDKVQQNSVVTADQAKRFQAYLDAQSPLTSAQIKERLKLLRQIDPKTTLVPVDPTPSTPAATPPPPASTPIVEDPKPAPKPDSANLPSSPNDLVFKPRSQSDGNGLVLVPVNYSEDVDAVRFYNREDQELANLTHVGKGSDGRTYWRLDKPGSEFGSDVRMELHFRDGTTIPYALNPSEYMQYRIGV